MGMEGRGVTSSDEYCDIYQKFMEAYDAGEDPHDISEKIIGEYLAEFGESDGVLHDVYFAVAKAQWMCGALNPLIHQKVRDIVENNQNILFLSELGLTDEKDILARRESLQAFLDVLSTPRYAPRKRNKPPEDKPLPEVYPGYALAFKAGDAYRVAVVLDRIHLPTWRPMLFCCILQRPFPCLPDVKQLGGEGICHIGTYIAEEFLPKSKMKMIGKIDVPPDLFSAHHANEIKDLETPMISYLGSKRDFFKEYPCGNDLLTLSEIIKKC